MTQYLDLDVDAVLADISYRLKVMPIEVGSGQTILALPHPDDVPWETATYGGWRQFMEHVNGRRKHVIDLTISADLVVT